eukprot:2544553-Rhodomonas_salina.2
MEGENMVKELAQYINQTNDARAQQGQNKILFTDPYVPSRFGHRLLCTQHDNGIFGILRVKCAN